jgi:RNA polymerase sigma-54 factor
MDMFQTHFQILRPLTTAHLAQTMTLLSLTADELRQNIEAELASNPALEMVEERRCPTCHRILPDHGSCPMCSRPQSSSPDDPVVFVSPSEDFYSGGSMPVDEIPEEHFSPITEDLPTYVLSQIATELAQADRRMAAYLLTHLDEDGLLTTTLEEVARYYHIPVSKVAVVQHIIQRAEPIGVGSCSTQEALLVQLDVLSETCAIPELARSIIRDGMDLLTHRQYGELARLFQVSLHQVQSTVKFISENLNPFPARTHWGDVRQPTPQASQVYHRPDILINYLNDDPKNPLVVEIILPYNGTLRVNPLFRQAIQQSSMDKREDWKNDLERASLYVKCLQQRNHTMQRLMLRIVSFQKDFILHGEKYMKPITRAQVSQELQVHESTISRAVASKTVQLPNRRIIPLSEFFDRSLNVRYILREMINRETHPLSDSELVDLLSEKGFSVARRTVAKYRSMEGILPAHLRHAMLQLA